jgi:hypothetical protein
MELKHLTNKHLDVIRRFVNSEEFADIKDAFIAHTPERGGEGRVEDSDSKNLGKFLGTRYVLNTLEQLAQKPPNTEQKKQPPGRPSSGRDADLET